MNYIALCFTSFIAVLFTVLLVINVVELQSNKFSRSPDSLEYLRWQQRQESNWSRILFSVFMLVIAIGAMLAETQIK